MEHKRITGNKAGAAKDRAAIKAQVEAYADARQKEKARVSQMGSYVEGQTNPQMSIGDVTDNTPKSDLIKIHDSAPNKDSLVIPAQISNRSLVDKAALVSNRSLLRKNTVTDEGEIRASTVVFGEQKIGDDPPGSKAALTATMNSQPTVEDLESQFSGDQETIDKLMNVRASQQTTSSGKTSSIPVLPPQKYTKRDLAQDDLCEFIRYYIGEIKFYSNIACQNILLAGQAIGIDAINNKDCVNQIGFSRKEIFEFTDSNKIGIVLVLKGQCKIVYQVKKFRDLTELPPDSGDEESEYLIDETRNNAFTSTPVQTMELEGRQKERHFRKRPKTIEFEEVSFELKQGDVLSDHTVNKLKINNYKKYFHKIEEERKNARRNHLTYMGREELYPKVLKYEDKLLRIEGVEMTDCQIMFVPFDIRKQVDASFCKDPSSVDDFLRQVVPCDAQYADKQIDSITRSLREQFCQPNYVIMKEKEESKWVYLLAEGEVRLYSNHNPFTGIAFRNDHAGLDSQAAISQMANASAQGNLSRSLHSNHIAVMQAGQWFGEEAVIMDMPIVYTAVAFTPCKLLKIHVSDFKECVPEDVINRMVKKTRKKVKWMRDRMSELHDERIKLQAKDPVTKNLHETVAHIQNIYPMGSRLIRQNIQHSLLQKTSNDHRLVMWADNKRPDAMREEVQVDQGHQTLKQKLYKKYNKYDKLETVIESKRELKKTVGQQGILHRAQSIKKIDAKTNVHDPNISNLITEMPQSNRAATLLHPDSPSGKNFSMMSPLRKNNDGQFLPPIKSAQLEKTLETDRDHLHSSKFLSAHRSRSVSKRWGDTHQIQVIQEDVNQQKQQQESNGFGAYNLKTPQHMNNTATFMKNKQNRASPPVTKQQIDNATLSSGTFNSSLIHQAKLAAEADSRNMNLLTVRLRGQINPRLLLPDMSPNQSTVSMNARRGSNQEMTSSHLRRDFTKDIQFLENCMKPPAVKKNSAFTMRKAPPS